MASKQSKAEYNQAQELENLARVFSKLDKNGDGKRSTTTPTRQVDFDEMWSYVKYLGHKCTKKEIEDMIWEVDENGDGCISWEEFRVMFERVKTDKFGWEPRTLYNMVEFMMVDKDCSGTIDLDECMEILYRRFGKNNLEEKDTDGEQTISFSEYIKGISQAAQTPHVGFKFSQGMVAQTKEENRKLLEEINATIKVPVTKAAKRQEKSKH